MTSALTLDGNAAMLNNRHKHLVQASYPEGASAALKSQASLMRRCLDALVTMGVLIPGNDMTAVRRTAQFFLTNFEERLAQQRAEAAANPEYGNSFKGELSKEEKKAKRKQILSSIGAPLRPVVTVLYTPVEV